MYTQLTTIEQIIIGKMPLVMCSNILSFFRGNSGKQSKIHTTQKKSFSKEKIYKIYSIILLHYTHDIGIPTSIVPNHISIRIILNWWYMMIICSNFIEMIVSLLLLLLGSFS